MRKYAILALSLLCLCLCACQPAPETSQPTTTQATTAPDVLHVVNVRTIGGDVPVGAAYYIYKGEEMQIHAFGRISDNAQITFMAPEGSNYVLKLEGVEKAEGMSEGYIVEPAYTVTSTNMEIVISSAPVQGKDPLEPGKFYHLGDVIRDFTVTDTEGNSYTLSEELKTKKCVVLNFWYVSCDPCKKEFPFLQKDYEAMNKDDVTFIALSPIDKMDKVADYKQDMGLTFPMGACDYAWQAVFSDPKDTLLTGYPTTIIIDRYGRICVVENKPVTEEGVLKAVVEYFTADDYEQTLVFDMEKFLEELAKG